MSKFTIKLHDAGRCYIRHEYADAKIVTDLPPEFGGSGRSFSSTDLVCAALGSCTLTTIDKVLEREGYDPTMTKIKVTKELSQSPRMIKSIWLRISHPKSFNDKLIKKLKKAAQACPVKRSLNQSIAIHIEFIIR